MTETQERFLRTVLTRVPIDSVVELHLFPSLRRGTVETGVAVIATIAPVAELAVVDVDDTLAPLDDDSPYSDDAAEAQASGLSASDADADGDVDDDVHVDADDDVGSAEIAAYNDTGHSPRHRILTASYRLTIKGLERGSWIVDVQHEADAPLDAVEAVLRGVRHRSTEPADPELLSRDTLLSLLSPTAVAPAA